MIHPFERILGSESDGEQALSRRTILKQTLAAGCGAAVLGSGASAFAQTTQVVGEEGGFINNNIGGISIDADGLLAEAHPDEQIRLARDLAANMDPVAADLQKPSKLRRVSLRQLQQSLAKANGKGGFIADEMRYLGGLQRIEYVFAYPEENDIVLAGPGEGWRAGDQGMTVGTKSQLPTMRLEDLVIALRSATDAVGGAISCSIDPTAAGIKKFRALTRKLTTIGNPRETAAALEQALGKQMITLKNVPASSSFALALVASDYRMKRLAMGFDPAPVRGLDSYLKMQKKATRGSQNAMPRWWLAPQYDEVLRDKDSLSWQLRGSGVKCHTENDDVSDDGAVRAGVGVDPVARRWADTMTAKYAELAAKQVIFGHLRNIMDLAVVSALIVKNRLAERCNLDLNGLLDPEQVVVSKYSTPRQIDSRATLLKKRKNWMISVSGGVLVDSWGIVDRNKVSGELAAPRSESSPSESNPWRWG